MAGGEGDVERWDDGHVPSLFPPGTGKMVRQRRGCAKGDLRTFQGVLDDALCDEIYRYSTGNSLPSWGTYVLAHTLAGPGKEVPIRGFNAAGREYFYGWHAARALLAERARAFIGDDWDRLDGIAVWALCSGPQNQVEYHIDYAERYRLESNITQPPLYAGTMHVSPVAEGEMDGGDFWAHRDGLEHYRRWGYKGKHRPSRDGVQADAAREDGWHRVPYRRNQGIVHDGDLPHLSTLVERIPAGKQRVILGFNAFTRGRAATTTRRAPEHSPQFRKRVKTLQLLGGSMKKGRDGVRRLLDLVKARAEASGAAAGAARDAMAGATARAAGDVWVGARAPGDPAVAPPASEHAGALWVLAAEGPSS